MQATDSRRFLTYLLTTMYSFIATVPEVAAAEQCANEPPEGRQKIGLVLGGGGARGAAHIGVLRKLEELKIPVDYITGTSMGAIVGGLYAAGLEVSEIESILVNSDWVELFNDSSNRRDRPLRRKSDDDLGLYGPRLGLGKQSTLLPGGAIAGQKISLLLENRISSKVQTDDFSQLPIPFRAIASDLVSGEMVELKGGSLGWALRASMSVPGAFDPVPFGKALLIDGGVTRNLPVDVVRDMGAQIVIAVNVEFPLLDANNLGGLLNIINQLTTIMVAGNTEAQVAKLDASDILIKPDLGPEFGSADFERIPDAIPLGYAAADALQQRLKTLSASPQQFQNWRQQVRDCVTGAPVVQFVKLDNRSRFSDPVIRNLLSVQPGQTLDPARMSRDLSRIHALGFIRSARYEVKKEGNVSGVVVQVEPDQRGSDFIETGLELTGDSRGSAIDLKVGYLKTDLNQRGSEFRAAAQLGNDQGLLAEVYMPFDDRLRWIFKPRLTASRRDLSAFDSMGNTVEKLQLEEVSGELSFGREFGRHAGIFVTAARYSGNIDVEIGNPVQENFRFNGGEWRINAVYDRLDNRYLPSSGSFLQLGYIASDRSLGADADFEQVEVNLFSAVTRGRHTAWFGSTLNSTVDDDAPVYALYSGGGFLNMSGFERDELIGQHFGFSMLGYRYRLGQKGILPAYAGMTVEYGAAAQSRGDIYDQGVLNGSFYLGYDSPLGPLYLGLGWSEEHSGLLFLRLGSVLGARSIGRR